MTDRKISELNNITGADLADNDEFVVVDTSADETKAITYGELKEAFDSGSGFVRITGDTMTGDLDVQGTVTADAATLSGTAPVLNYTDTDNSITAQIGSGTSDFNIATTTSHNIDIRTNNTRRMVVESDGDISFYDTSGNAKLFWDASAESLGIGTSSPSKKAHLYASNDSASLRLENTANSKVWDITPARPGVANTGLSIHNVTDDRIDLHVDNSGNVGIGTSSPTGVHSLAKVLELDGGDGSEINLGLTAPNVGSGAFVGGIGFKNVDGSLGTAPHYAGIKSKTTSTLGTMDLRFYSGTGNYEADTPQMLLDASGNLLVGKTALGGTAGTTLYNTGLGYFVVDGNRSLLLDRLTSDGNLMEFRKDNTTVGSIGTKARTSAGRIFVGNSNTRLLFDNGVDAIIPANNDGNDRDNAIDLGASGTRFDDIYATNGTIQTSDRNEKQDIASLTSAEMLVAKRISALFKTFRWKDKVAAKGDNARTHTGIIAQDVQAAFTAESLDAGDYSLFISSTWWEHDVDVPAVEAVAEVTEDVVIAAVEEELDEEGNVLVEAQEERTEQRVITEAVEAVDAYTRTDTYDTEDEAPAGATSKTRMGIRYPELLSFVAAYNEQRFAAIETRLTALEG